MLSIKFEKDSQLAKKKVLTSWVEAHSLFQISRQSNKEWILRNSSNHTISRYKFIMQKNNDVVFLHDVNSSSNYKYLIINSTSAYRSIYLDCECNEHFLNGFWMDQCTSTSIISIGPHANYFYVYIIVVLIIISVLSHLCLAILRRKKKRIKRETDSNRTPGLKMSPLINKLDTHDQILDFNNFKKEVCIGRGGFGTVNLCSIPPDFNRKFVVKLLDSVPSKEVLKALCL